MKKTTFRLQFNKGNKFFFSTGIVVYFGKTYTRRTIFSFLSTNVYLYNMPVNKKMFSDLKTKIEKIKKCHFLILNFEVGTYVFNVQI